MNRKISEMIRTLLGVLNADITTDRTGAYHDVSGSNRILARLDTGAVAAASNATIQLLQATDDAGTGAKALSAVVTAVSAAGEALAVEVEAQTEDMDTNNGYTHVAVQVTSDNATAVVGSAVLLLAGNRFNP